MIDSDNPVVEPPGTEHPHPQVPSEPPKTTRKAKKNETTENIAEMGSTEVPTAKSNIHVMTIIGQIEGQPPIVI